MTVRNEAAGRWPRRLVPLYAKTPTEVLLGYARSVTDVTEVSEGGEQPTWRVSVRAEDSCKIHP
jgi:hypothetical protein